ncbi:ImmA/IrrE family metallo-endopeptidase [Terrisporobacter glycolicus]|uniref:IrrE N-terminal-like domain-containing protein n=1 Tax=Terrisporobacter glycolicus ATCC 14880 = DSM 1288 TaxID=1121315 RepID=A0ABZ2EXF4_9FIRM|nr:ImmA/IrrE family metallo-endopeptidase [Terrisporobacter glycolicus]
MNKLEQLYNLAFDLTINIFFFDLKAIGCLGLNVEKNELGHVIFLDNSLKNNNKIHAEVLAHEIGHFYTTIGNNLNNSSTYRDELYKNKVENKADRWAYNYLIPEKDLVVAIKKGITDMQELAEYFDVRLEFLMKRLEYLALLKQMIKLENNKYLVLTNLPNLHTYEDL